MNTKLSDISSVISRALPLCEPTSSEQSKISTVAEKCRMLVQQQARGNREIVDVIFGGSYAKGTWLHGDADVDIFLMIKPSVDSERFEAIGKGIGLAALKKYGPKLRYADHPYVEASVSGIRVNVVPCYDVEMGRWQSAADRSPYHTEYILRNFDAQRKTQSRLLKRFLKSAGIYGAEISVGGFSGYVSEVLVMKYGSFADVLAAAAKITHRQVIAVNEQFDSDVLKGFTSPLIIIDPVDDRRNLGTAISAESVGKFVLAARSFLSSPATRFFGRRLRSRSAARRLYPNILIVELGHRERSPDVIWGQLKRSMGAITKQLTLADFKVMRASCITNEKSEAALAFLLESLSLPVFTRRKGPEVFRNDDSSSFLRNPKNKSHVAWVDSEIRVEMLIDRKDTDAIAFVKSLFGKRSGFSGISKDLLADKNMLRIYSGRERRLSGLAKEVVDDIVSTEHFILWRI